MNLLVLCFTKPFNSINVVYYKTAPNRLQQIHQQKTAQQKFVNRLNNDWREEVTIADRYEKHRPEFLEMLKEFEAI